MSQPLPREVLLGTCTRKFGFAGVMSHPETLLSDAPKVETIRMREKVSFSEVQTVTSRFSIT